MQINQEIKGRGGSLIKITNDEITIKKGILKGEMSFKKSDISLIEIKKSAYDLPFLEKTLIFQVNGKQYKIKHLPAKKAEQLKSSLI